MAEFDTNEIQLESLDLQAKLIEALKKVYGTEHSIVEELEEKYNLQKKILESAKGEEGVKNKILNIEKELSRKGKEYEDMIERVGKGMKLSGHELKIIADIEKNRTSKAIELKNLQDELHRHERLMDALSRAGLGNLTKKISAIRDLLKYHPMFAAVAGLGLLFTGFAKIFHDMDKAASKFRIEMGFVRSDTQAIEEIARSLTFGLLQAGISAEDIYNSFKAIASSLGSVQYATKDMVRDMALMSTQLGVSQTTSAEFLRIMAMMGKTTLDAQSNMALFESKLSAAAGTNLSDVMMDVSNASRNSYQFLSRNPLVLAKAAVEAKRMGTSLTEAASAADILIRFTDSIASEMQASVLLGQSINLQRARELAYRKDLRGVNEEILKIAKQTHFEDLDPFQQEAVAKAFGKSADQLGKMLQSDREMSKIRSDASLQKQLTTYNQLKNANQQIVKDQAESARHQLSILSNQESIKAITMSIHAIFQRMFEGPVRIASVILPKIAAWLGAINERTNGWGSSIGGVVALVGLLIGARYLGKLVGWAIGGVGKGINSLFGGLSSGVIKMGGSGVIKGALGLLLVSSALIPLAYSLKLMNGVNWKTFGIMAVSLAALTASVAVLGAVMESGVGAVAILAGAAALAIIGASMIPFAYAAKLMSSALASLQGINLMGISLGLIDISFALTPLVALTPFLPIVALGLSAVGLSLRFIAGPAERVGRAVEMMSKGLDTVVNSLSQIKSLELSSTIDQIRKLSISIEELNKSINSVPDVKVEKLGNVIMKSNELNFQVQTKNNDEMLLALENIRQEVSNLRKDFASGGISTKVQIGAQQLDVGMARELAFTGPLQSR